MGRRGRRGEGRLPRVVGRGRRRHAVPGPGRRRPGHRARRARRRCASASPIGPACRPSTRAGRWSGPGADHLRGSPGEVLSGTTQHGGALLAPFGVRFVVADARLVAAGGRGAARQRSSISTGAGRGPRDLPQRRARARPPPSSTPTRRPSRPIHSGTPSDVARLGAVDASPLDPIEGGWSGGQGRGPGVHLDRVPRVVATRRLGPRAPPRRSAGPRPSNAVEAPVSVRSTGRSSWPRSRRCSWACLDRGAVDHQEAGGAMRATRPGGRSRWSSLGVIVARGGRARSARHEVARPGAAGRSLQRSLVLPARRRDRLAGHPLPRQPGRRRRRRPPHRLGEEGSKPGDTVTVPPAARCASRPRPPSVAPRATWSTSAAGSRRLGHAGWRRRDRRSAPSPARPPPADRGSPRGSARRRANRDSWW